LEKKKEWQLNCKGGVSEQEWMENNCECVWGREGVSWRNLFFSSLNIFGLATPTIGEEAVRKYIRTEILYF